MRKIYTQPSRPCYLAALMLVCFSTSIYAELPEGFVGTRPIGMGGAFTAVANDENSMFTNPAGVARVRKARSRSMVHIARFPNLNLGFNAASRGLYSTIKSNSKTELADAIAASNILSDKPFYVRAGAFPVIMFEAGKNLPAGFGLFQNSVSKIYIDKDIPADARMVSITDVGAAIGIGMTNFSNRLNLGLTLRPTYRYAFENSVPVVDLKSSTAIAKKLRQDSNAGTGIGVDIGAMVTLADFWFPTVGIAVRNLPTGCQDDYLNPLMEERQKICGTKFSGGDGNPDALSRIDPMDVRAGVSISPRIGKDFGIRFAADIHNAYLKSTTAYYGLPGADASKLLHGGVELFSGNPLEQSRVSARVGANQGFVTYGASLNLPWFHLDFASYGVDVSDQAKRVEDRRFLISAGLSY